MEICNIYRPSSKLCIDETIAPFMGRFKYLTYNPQKPEKWGIRLIAITDAETSFCLTMIPQLRGETYRFLKVKDLNELLIEQMKSFASPQSSLYIDNYRIRAKYPHLEKTVIFIFLGPSLELFVFIFFFSSASKFSSANKFSSGRNFELDLMFNQD